MRRPFACRHRKRDHQPERSQDQGPHPCGGRQQPHHSARGRDPVRAGVFVIPDILANAGGVTVSYFEWVQDRQGYFWTETDVNESSSHQVAAFDDVVHYGEKHNVNNRIAAYMLAIDRVAFSLKLRGIYA